MTIDSSETWKKRTLPQTKDTAFIDNTSASLKHIAMGKSTTKNRTRQRHCEVSLPKKKELVK
jgi:hypothetical protein